MTDRPGTAALPHGDMRPALNGPSTSGSTSAAVIGTLALAAVAWIASVRQMAGMDMGVGTDLGAFGPFVAVWVSMTAAMMLPAAAPKVAAQVVGRGLARTAAFGAAYLAVWVLVGLAIYPLYRPHGATAAGIVVMLAGAYELTPVKRRFRDRSRESSASGVWFGLCCLGSSAGLMALFVVLGPMSLTWMTVISVVMAQQKWGAPARAVDVPLGLAIVGFGVLVLVAPASVPGLLPAM